MTALADTSAAILTLARTMPRNTPSASSRTAAEATPEIARAVAARPRVATVPVTQEGGTAAEAMSPASAEAISPADGANPRRVSRTLSFSRARSSLPRTDPSVQRSRLAACWCDLPSR